MTQWLEFIPEDCQAKSKFIDFPDIKDCAEELFEIIDGAE